MRSLRRPAGLIGFGLAAAFAVAGNWSLPEFCWSTSLTGLAYSWACVMTAAAQILATAGRQRADYEDALPFLRAPAPDEQHRRLQTEHRCTTAARRRGAVSGVLQCLRSLARFLRNSLLPFPIPNFSDGGMT